MEIVITKEGQVIGSRIKLAVTFWQRLKGLLGTKSLAEGQGLLLRPCSQVHTWFMGYTIDVVFLDEYGRIVGLEQNMKAGQVSPKYHKSWQVLELPSGSVEKYNLRRGDFLEILYSS